jgi:CheY-like chemotaxis protein
VQDVAKLVEAVAAVVGAVAWPAVILMALIYVGRRLDRGTSDGRTRTSEQSRPPQNAERDVHPVAAFVDSFAKADEVAFKAAGVEVTRMTASESTIKLLAAENLRRGVRDASTEADSDTAEAVTRAVASVSTSLEGALALWVDDNPAGNGAERRALEAEGVRFQNVRSTDDAMDELTTGGSDYSLVISDWSRPDDDRDDQPAAIGLLERMRTLHGAPPVVIYTLTRHKSERHHQAVQHGAFALATTPTELYRYAAQALAQPRGEPPARRNRFTRARRASQI